MIFRADEGVEERPGATRQRAQEKDLCAAQDRRAARQRAADPPGEQRRGEPQEQNRSRHQQHRRRRQGQMQRGCRSQGGRYPHRPQQSGKFAAASPGGSAFGIDRRSPFEQAPMRDQHSPVRTHDRIQTVERLVRETGKLEDDLPEVPCRRACHRRQMLPQQHLARLAKQFEDHRAAGGQQHDPEHRQGP
ncbi:MAG: hypothetical protein CAPSK01_003330 [Candidatus Accumulibacter vicinus]|uniref:Uncharacterized protein n=1 Tax=Candidatus Accumulibacter vicinus TaxID=2954382 RepID=A0A084XXL9_9PROT|nr:MAG: hypothetical protein CAPSK01_003330 [Candidatus Accumulibacter vicinus]